MSAFYGVSLEIELSIYSEMSDIRRTHSASSQLLARKEPLNAVTSGVWLCRGKFRRFRGGGKVCQQTYVDEFD